MSNLEPIVSNILIEKLVNGYLVYENHNNINRECATSFSERKVFKDLKSLTTYLKEDFNIKETQSNKKP